MRHVKLEAKTHAAKNKLKNVVAALDWSGAWNVIGERDTVLFSDKPGPWLYLTPDRQDGIVADRLGRWVHATDDDNFIVRFTHD